MQAELYTRIEEYITGLYGHVRAPTLAYHNLLHTQNVVKHTREIAGYYNVSENEVLILFTAAWFHDTGYLFAEPQKHEEMSCFVMRKYMSDKLDNINIVNNIEECIMATKPPVNPRGLLQHIICDADAYHLGTRDFEENDKRALEEFFLKHLDTDPVQFNKDTIKMLVSHCFYTDYCKERLNEQKENNMIILQMKIIEAEDKQRRLKNIN